MSNACAIPSTIYDRSSITSNGTAVLSNQIWFDSERFPNKTSKILANVLDTRIPQRVFSL